MGARVPDYRGYFLRGHGGNSAELGIAQGDAIRNITGTAQRIVGDTTIGTDALVYKKLSNNARLTVGSANYGLFELSLDISRIVPTANENRPINKSVRYMIRALP